MICYGHVGRRADAIRRYLLFADHLVKDLQVQPMPETQIIVRKSVRVNQSATKMGTNVGLMEQSISMKGRHETWRQFQQVRRS